MAGGMPPIEAGSVIAERVKRILSCRAAGNRLVHEERAREL